MIQELLKEESDNRRMEIPGDANGQKSLLRGLMNVRQPGNIHEEFLAVQDEYLREETREKGITDIEELSPVSDGIYLWQGDITTLRCGAIVNAANSGMTGCYSPCHNCIDNCIHTYAGVQLRLACDTIIRKQGHEEGTGQAKITPAFNLPCEYVLHTVGPIVSGRLTEEHKRLLASCYRSCMELAEQYDLPSIAFCCISTGVFHFPNEEAAEIAIKTVEEYREQTKSSMKVIFNVFGDRDYEIYRELLEGRG